MLSESEERWPGTIFYRGGTGSGGPETTSGADFVYPYHNPDGSENLFACRWELTAEDSIKP